MNKFQEFIELLKKAGISHTLGTDEHNQPTVGVYLGKHVYHWFKSFAWLNGDVSVSFSHSYSHNTGRTKAGVMHGLRIKDSISARIGSTDVFAL